jgi:hypothetical protein
MPSRASEENERPRFHAGPNLLPLNQLKVLTTLVLCLASAVCVRPARPVNATPGNPIPGRWVDLPDAPFVAQIRDGEPVLVARSKQTFSHVGVGCVVEVDGKAHVIAELMESFMTHGAFGPNWPVTNLISSLTNPEVYRHLSQWGRCPSDSFFAVTVAIAVDRKGSKEFVWKAEGTAWTVGRFESVEGSDSSSVWPPRSPLVARSVTRDGR